MILPRHSVSGENQPMKILVPVDGSEPSLRAVKLAIALAKGARASDLLLVTVQNLAPLGATDLGLLDPVLVHKAAQRMGEEALRKAVRLVKATKLRFATKVETGPIAKTLARIARNERVDHIVMGTRGLGGVRGLLLGSVATQLMHLATVPVTLVK
jgi:nucleotide-binding universal stress UspA family protein